MKTKLEILEETKNYFNSTNRGVDKNDYSCRYVTEEGMKCALGRCMDDEKVLELMHVHVTAENLINIPDEYLKPEYRGHDIEFWTALQIFHDMSENWDEKGLTDIGQTHYNVLRNLYENEA